MKLACVVHRYGTDFAGGSEGHCRLIAERLAATHDVTVLTTCARDHVTWQNAYPPGRSELAGVGVQRFPVTSQRSMQRFAAIGDAAMSGEAPRDEQEQWFVENGPVAPALLEHLRHDGGGYDLVLFWAFRYWETFFGLPLVEARAVLVPTAEEDPVIRMPIVGELFARPRGFVFLTPEEQALVERWSVGPPPPSCVIGSGLEPAASSATNVDLASRGIASDFVLYLGRIDPNKGCDTLLDHFVRHQAHGGAPVQLVMAGPANMPLPNHPAIKYLGYVDEALREALLARARALIMPSPYESLSLVLLEAWNHGLPALVNARCAVLKGQTLRADGGVYYRTADEFAHALDYLLAHPDTARQLGRQGLDYIDRHYRWPRVIGTLNRFLDEMRTTTVAAHAS